MAGWVPGIAPPGLTPVPYPGYTLPATPVHVAGYAMPCSQDQIVLWAQIRRSTHFKSLNLRV